MTTEILISEYKKIYDFIIFSLRIKTLLLTFKLLVYEILIIALIHF